MEKLLIIDGNSILNRAFYGVKPLTTKDGLPTNAVFGMFNILTKNINALKPDYAVVAFDLKAPTFRHKLYDGYKANRKGMPEELAAQLPYAKECMRGMGLSVMELEGFEADDLLGTLSSIAKEKGISSYLLTGDRDSLQLIDDSVTVMLVTNKETVEFDRSHFRETYGIDPSVFVDVKALMGDSSDNIPGVAGIGEKTALKLISEFSSLDGVYSGFEDSKLTPNMKDKLRSGKESAYLSKTLATIVRDAPVEFSDGEFRYKGIEPSLLKPLFEKLEFFALIKKLGIENASSESDTDIGTASADKKEYTITDVEDISSLSFSTPVAVSLSNGVITVCDGERIYRINSKTAQVEEISKLLSSARLIIHDSKSFYKTLAALGIHHRECVFDTMLGAYVLNSSRRGYSLPEVYLEYVGVTLPEELPHSAAVYEIYGEMADKIKSEGAEKLLCDIEIPLAAVLSDMEIVGIKLDVEGIRGYGEELDGQISELKERIYCHAGEEFNIDSPKQLGIILFERLGLPTFKKTKTGYSTDADVLNKLLGKHEIIEDILEYRQLSKLRSTYTDALADLADSDGRIHTVFNQTGTATGRLSSSEPNLQNIPVKTDVGRRFRKYFTAKDGDHVIVDADYSQIELRLLAAISGDGAMISAFTEGVDIHSRTAATVFGIPEDQVTSELRKRAKAVNFGIVYGIGEYSLSEDLGISRAKAKEYIDSYLAGFPMVGKYLEDIKERAREDGFVSTLFGRKRYIPELSASNKNLQHFGERVAMNSPIQGTAADIMKIAMINTAKALRAEGVEAEIILQVHDELLLEASREDAERAMEILIREMENAVRLEVPLSVEANMGNTWYEAK